MQHYALAMWQSSPAELLSAYLKSDFAESNRPAMFWREHLEMKVDPDGAPPSKLVWHWYCKAGPLCLDMQLMCTWYIHIYGELMQGVLTSIHTGW